MNTKYYYFLLIIFLLAGCARTDFDELRRIQENQQDQLDDHATRIARLELAVSTINSNINALQAIIDALQNNMSIKSYTTTPNGYLLTMSDGSTITLHHGQDGKDGQNGTNGKDGMNAPSIGIKKDLDNHYYWTLAGEFILQDGKKMRVTGDNGTDGKDAITPILRVDANANQWLISYNEGNTWQVVKDTNGNPVPATGDKGDTGDTGQQGPSGIPGFAITEDDGVITITYNGQTFSIPTRTVWKSVLVGGYSTFLLAESGELYGLGDNRFGQLGIGDINIGSAVLKPTFITDNIKSMTSNENHSLILKNDGTVWAAGSNSWGAAGLGSDFKNFGTLTQVIGENGGYMTDVKAVAAGLSHSMFLKNDGTVWVVGQNNVGQLSANGINIITVPIQPRTNTGEIFDAVDSIAANFYSSLVLKDGRVWSFGRLADTQNYSPTPILNHDGSPVTQVKSIQVGFDYIVVLKTDGTVYTLGQNFRGQLGNGTTVGPYTRLQEKPILTEVVQIATNGQTTFMIRSDGSLWGCGRNEFGQLGIGNNTALNTPTQILPTGVRQIAAGWFHCLILKEDGSIYSTGYNPQGQLGLGHKSNVNVFTKMTVLDF